MSQASAKATPKVQLAARQAYFWELVAGRQPIELERGVFAEMPHFPAARAVGVYRSMYRTRIGETLRSTYPGLEARVGQAEFRRLAMRYLDENPSRDARLEFVGERLPHYLRDHPKREWRALASVAMLEWAYWAAPLAPDPEEIFSIEQLKPEQFAASRLVLIPSLHLVEVARAEYRAVWSEGGCLRERAVESLEALALRAALDGESLPAICECFAACSDPVEQARQSLGAWIAGQWVIRLETLDLSDRATWPRCPRTALGH